MGGLCSCCPRPEELEEMAGFPGGPHFQHCYCLRCCMRWFLRLYAVLSGQSDGREPPISSLPSLSPLSPLPSPGLQPAPIDSISDAFRTLPRPLPYDSNSRYVTRREGLSRRDKGGSIGYLASETEPLRRNSESGEAMTALQRRGGTARDETESMEPGGSYWPESPHLRHVGSKTGIPKVDSFMSFTDEDCCPTCLDGYTEENPKISTDCGHHYHLSCIYEWMERSKHCPVCNKVMVFAESL